MKLGDKAKEQHTFLYLNFFFKQSVRLSFSTDLHERLHGGGEQKGTKRYECDTRLVDQQQDFPVAVCLTPGLRSCAKAFKFDPITQSAWLSVYPVLPTDSQEIHLSSSAVGKERVCVQKMRFLSKMTLTLPGLLSRLSISWAL